MVSFAKKYLIVSLLAVAAAAAIKFLILTDGEPARERIQNGETIYDTSLSIAEDSREIFRDRAALFSYVKKFGPEKTTKRLYDLGYKEGFGDCHDTAHEAGRYAYQIFGEQSFKLCSAECHSGCYHGATEAYFRDHGTANLEKNLATLCSSELNSFFSHQCIHGIGHGLMAWTNYEIFEALESCNILTSQRDSCWSGVFMENIVGGLVEEEVQKSDNAEAAAHFTRFLSDDPLYPCNDPELPDQYKPSCYFLQTSRMVQLFGADFLKVANACQSAPEPYQRSCFESMGRDVGGSFRGNPAGAIGACGNAPEGVMRIGCLIGAAQDSFWDPGGQEAALRFCKLLTDKAEKNSCYETIFERAPQVLASAVDLKRFCEKAESEYRSQCLSYARL